MGRSKPSSFLTHVMDPLPNTQLEQTPEASLAGAAQLQIRYTCLREG